MGSTYFIIGHPVGLQVSGTLVEFAAILKADTVHHQVAVQMVGVHMGSHQHLEVWELTLNQFQPNGVGLLGRQVIRLRKGLHEVIVLSAVCLMEPLLGELHFEQTLWAVQFQPETSRRSSHVVFSSCWT